MKLKYNPFNDSGIVSYEQFKNYPFLVFGNIEEIKNRINEQITQIKDGYFFGERLIFLGERGIGKTSSLFFIHDMLKENNIQSFLFSRLIEDSNQLDVSLNKINPGELTEKMERLRIINKSFSFNSLLNKPTYFLIDFPDTFETKQFKKFLDFLWSLLTHKNYNKINLIFCMNISHYEKSYSYSEILGKFTTIRLERLDYNETINLISSRLKVVDECIENVFDSEIMEMVYNYSKGVPRNIISACSLLINNSNGYKIDKSLAEKILKEKYVEQVINDRVEDLELRNIYQLMVSILKNNFNGTAKSQEDYVKKVVEIVKVGRNSVLSRINDLTRFGIIKQYRGGYNRVNKIISMN